MPLPDADPDSIRRTPGPAIFDIRIEGDTAGTVVTSAMRNATGIDIIATPSNESVSGEDILDVLKGHFVEAARRIYPEDEISFLIRPDEETPSPGM